MESCLLDFDQHFALNRHFPKHAMNKHISQNCSVLWMKVASASEGLKENAAHVVRARYSANTVPLAHGNSFESAQRELSNKYQHDRVFKKSALNETNLSMGSVKKSETLTHGNSYASAQRELSNEYQHDRVFKKSYLNETSLSMYRVKRERGARGPRSL